MRFSTTTKPKKRTPIRRTTSVVTTSVRSIARAPRSTAIVKTQPKYFIGNLTSSNAAAVLGAMSFTKTSAGDSSSMSAVFDQYRITKIKVFIISNNTPQAPGASTAIAQVYTAIDYDDAVAPSTVTEVLNYDNSMIHVAGANATRTFRPKVIGYVYGGGSTAGEVKESPWLDCATSSIEHFGLKYCVTQGTSTNQLSWSLWAQLFIEYKNAR